MENIKDESTLGVVRISDEVVSVIASIAAEEIQGKKTTTGKSVKVTLGEDAATIELTVAVEYGINIPEVISLVQENVKKTVEAMTGLNVEAVNVNVQNIYVPKKEQNLEKEV